MILFEVIVPVILIFAIGYGVQKIFHFNIESISILSIYVLMPFLVFQTFYRNQLNWNYLYIFLFCVLFCIILLILSYLYGKLRRKGKTETTGFMMAVTFMNAGNYGAPLILFTFGEEAFTYAIIVMVVQSLLMNTVGLYLAANGSSVKEELSISPWMKILKMPVVYSLIIGILLQSLDIQIPSFVEKPVGMLADATIPVVMLALGMQLARIQFKKVNWYDLSVVNGMRMLLSPVIAVILLSFITLDPLIEKVLIVGAAMPTAANITLFSIQFKTEPDFVSAVTLTTTIVSIITVPIVLIFLGV